MGRRKKRAKIPILVIGDAVATTGFARVLNGILGNLPRNKYDIHHLGVNYRGDPHDHNWKIYPAQLGGDVYGVNRIPELVEKVKPKLIFVLNDLWILEFYLEQALDEHKENIPIVCYTPIDAGPVIDNWLKGLDGIARLVVYTEFASKEIKQALNAMVLDEDGKVLLDREIPALSVIAHGVDTSVFYPWEDVVGSNGVVIETGRERAKRELYPNRDDFSGDSFIILNSNRNQPRKRIDITIKGFAKFAKNKPQNVKLYLHMGIEDSGWNILQLAKRYGVDDRLILTSTVNVIPGVPDNRMNHIYNACDVGLNTSTGEGWGLTSFEHAATRAAQIVPNHSACTEIWEGNAEMLEPKFSLTNEKVLTEGQFVSDEDVAESLEKLYEDPEYLEEMSDKAYRLVTQQDYSWKKIARQWDNLFTEVLEE
jgi:glycosyltransferase involved in cell wall biosynthesis